MGIDICLNNLQGKEKVYAGFGYGDYNEEDEYILRQPHVARFVYSFIDWHEKAKPTKFKPWHLRNIRRGLKFLEDHSDVIQINEEYMIPKTCVVTCISKLRVHIRNIEELLSKEEGPFYWEVWW